MTRKIIIDGEGPFGLSVKDEDGEILPVSSLSMNIKPNDIVRADVELAIARVGRMSAEATCYFDGREVKRIEFADGGVEEF